MKIYVSNGIGSGPTELSAFDSALHEAGISNFNLLPLSSVIPPGSEVVTNAPRETVSKKVTGDWGDRLYVVMAENRTSTPGEEVWSGIGWVQDEVSGKGLFVEHEGSSEEYVKNQITLSLQKLMETRGIDLGDIKMQVVGVKCEDDPVCSLVIASYESQGWASRAADS